MILLACSGDAWRGSPPALYLYIIALVNGQMRALCSLAGMLAAAEP